MRCGLFGKLPAKRDFVALNAPRDLLTAWEGWLQGGLSASRQSLGPAWQDAYLRAPIWRFWLGGEVAGASTLGAFMPSVDGVGRYFPLSVFVQSDPAERLPPPELDGHEPWFEGAERLLLSALGEGVTYEDFAAAVAQAPAPSPGPAPPDATPRARDGTLGAAVADGVEATFAGFRLNDQARLYGGMTCWWTVGGEGFAPLAFMARRMPDPYVFTAMLTGRFDDVRV